jgi:WD40 repeat protein
MTAPQCVRRDWTSEGLASGLPLPIFRWIGKSAIYQIVGLLTQVSSVAVSPDGRMLASGGGDGSVILRNADIESWVGTIPRTRALS